MGRLKEYFLNNLPENDDDRSRKNALSLSRRTGIL